MTRIIGLLPLFLAAFTPAVAACRDMPPPPPPPPHAALEACRQLPQAASCRFQLGEKTIAGQCLAPPSLPLACVPAGMTPGLPPGPPPGK